MTSSQLNLKWVRGQFPGLKNNMVFMDNAGGSQTLTSVINKISEYLIESNVQLGASYKTSQSAGEKLLNSRKAVQNWIHAKHIEEIIIGSSTTMLLRILSLCISENWKKGDEVIITNCDHEANMAPWRDLQKKGITIKTWKINPQTFKLHIEDLQDLLTEKTRLVAVTHVSNVLGSINPIKQIAKAVHENGSLICVDGVAYAPHRQIDVQELDVDFYGFSTYKTFGPHQAVLYGKRDLLESMNGINHPFIKDTPYKFQPGNVNFELAYSLSAIPEYLQELGDGDIKQGYKKIKNYEAGLTEKLLTFLNTIPEIKILGENNADFDQRVSTISFIHANKNSQEIVEQVDKYNIGIRFGSFYAEQLIDDLGLRERNGVVRVSLVHYNSETEVNKLIQALSEII